jgi:hypothetical protein
MNNLSMTIINSILLTQVPEDMRGRVLGVRMQMPTTISAGTLLTGAIADSFGASLALGLDGILWGLSVLVIVRLTPKLRKIT